MTSRRRKFQVMTATLITLSASIGPADAVGPRTVSKPAAVVTAPAGKQGAAMEMDGLPPEPVAGQPTSLLPSRTPHAGVATDLFAGHSWYTPPPPATPLPETRATIDRKPTAPPLPFAYIGSLEQDGADTYYYLVKGDRVYDVKAGDVVEGVYRVEGPKNGQLMFTYLPLESSQGLRLGD